MALVNVVNMAVLDNPTNFQSPFQFEITFECLQELEDDLEWKVLYVSKAEDMSKDLVLDEILVGPVPVGVNKFVLTADAPDGRKIDDLLGVTVVLITCSYKEREFIRVGYYVNNEYIDENYTNQTEGEENTIPPPPQPIDLSKVTRTILHDKPRVTKFPISWGDAVDENAGASNNEGEADSKQMDTSASSPDAVANMREALVGGDKPPAAAE